MEDSHEDDDGKVGSNVIRLKRLPRRIMDTCFFSLACRKTALAFSECPFCHALLLSFNHNIEHQHLGKYPLYNIWVYLIFESSL